MDLPPDKAKLLKSYDDEKKWDLICYQVRHTPPPPLILVLFSMPGFICSVKLFISNLLAMNWPPNFEHAFV
jgi:hypothetical protein